MVHPNAILWNKILINVRSHESTLFDTDNSISSKLRYHRKIAGLSRRQLERELNIPINTLNKYEDKNVYPTKEVSEKLAAFFKIDTKYFYDSMYEEDINVSTTLNTFKINNNLSIRDLGKLINTSEVTVSTWLSNKHTVSRKTYYKLKELGVLS